MKSVINKYLLGDREFRNKAEITKYIGNILNTSEIGAILIGEPSDVLFDLIKWHPNFTDSWGDCFKVVINIRNQRNFTIKDTSGIWWNFSYHKCIAKSTKQKNDKCNVIQLFRDSIKQQIDEFRDTKKITVGTSIKYKCEIDGNLYNRTDINIDHTHDEIPFKKIYLNFLNINNLDFADVKIVTVDTIRYFTDDNLKNKWLVYHRENAKLRVIHKLYNLQAKKYKPM